MLLSRIIRYAGYLPKKADDLTKFDTIYDRSYAEQAALHRIDLYHKDNNTGDVYLLVSRIAPSLKIKRVAIGIHLRMEGDSITHYNEVFRTWKMEEAVLEEKGGLLYNLMVKGKDLSPYYPQHSGKEEYIEFPDEHTRFDVDKRTWVSDMENPLAPYYELKRGVSEN
ncbi:MAG: hypothetical protein KF852_11005 [Saprospiraceae bacterium]|nr:hypothetical protein [Saprospiraceae bacterium]